MRHNPLDDSPTPMQSRNPWTLEDKLDWCAAENRRKVWIDNDRWWFVRPGSECDDGVPRIAFVEGLNAYHARMAANGKPFVQFDPEPGEQAWIERAIGEFIRRKGPVELLHATLARWSEVKPWRQTEDAA